MQVVILAGGEGTRLRPLTGDTPKPLVRVLGTPVIERLTALLFRCGFREATVADFYLADKLEKELGSVSNGINIRYVREEIPLGTAGCVRRAWNGDDVLIVSGDSVCDFDFKDIADFHAKKSADVTIVTHRVADPREYGLVTADEQGRVVGFLEKPGYDSCLTDVANTGAYVISADIISRIPKDEKVDFAKDVFPELLKEDKRILSYPESGVWHDIGDIPSLLKCQAELLEKENEKRLIFKGSFVSESAVIGEGSVIESGAVIGSDCRVQSSCILSGASLGDGCLASNAVIGENVTVGRGCEFLPFCAVGKNCVIGSAVKIDSGVRIAAGTKIPSGAHIRSDITGGGFRALMFGDGGIAEGISKSSVDTMRLGMAASCALNIGEAVVGCDKKHRAAAESLILGLRSCGTAVFGLENSSLGETVFAARKLKSLYCLYVGEDIRLFRSDRLELSRSEERKIEQQFNRGELRESAHAPLINAEAASALYKRELSETLPAAFSCKASVKTDNQCESEIFEDVFLKHGENSGERLEFVISPDSTSVFCRLDDRTVPYEALILLGCRSMFSKRLGVRLPMRSPLACDEYARQEGLSVTHVSASDDIELTPFSYDALFLIAEVISYISARGISLSAACSELPDIVYTKRTVSVGTGLPGILNECFKNSGRGNDIVYQSEGARAYAHPCKNGKSLSLYVESVSAEAAESLCEDIIKKLGALSDKE